MLANNKKIVLIAVLLVAWSFASFFAGYKLGSALVQKQWDKEKTSQLEKRSDLLMKGIGDNYKLGLQYEEKNKEVQFITREIIKEVPVIMPSSESCPHLPDGFARLHNDAAGSASSSAPTPSLNDSGSTP